MQQVVCPHCSAELGEAESDQYENVCCSFCGEWFLVEPEEDVGEMYRRQEEEERDRLMPDRSDTPRLPN